MGRGLEGVCERVERGQGGGGVEGRISGEYNGRNGFEIKRG